MWSLSAHKQFKRCPRQWFYKYVMADGRVKRDPLRIEAYRLSKLKTIAAWRGLLVDQVISVFILPRLRQKRLPTLQEVLSTARRIFDKWYELATTPLPQGQKLEVGLLEMETKGFVSSEALSIAWKDVESALTNFMKNETLLVELISADYLAEQQTLWCRVSNNSVKGIPDLIAFWRNRPPIIYDWKVHFYGTTSHERQLLIYALALANNKSRADFEPYLAGHQPENTGLTEVQLISQSTGYQRTYTVTTTKLDETRAYIANSMLSMYLAGTHRKYNQSSADDYDTADDPEVCSTCAFCKLCKQH